MNIVSFSVPKEIAYGRDCCLAAVLDDKCDLAVGQEVTCQCGSVFKRDAEKSIKFVSVGDKEYMAFSYPLARNTPLDGSSGGGGIEIHTGWVNPKTGAFRWEAKPT